MITMSRPTSVFYWYTAATALVMTALMPPLGLVATSASTLEGMRAHPLPAALFVVQVALTTVAEVWWLERWRRGTRDGSLPRWALVAAAIPAMIALALLLAAVLGTSGTTGPGPGAATGAGTAAFSVIPNRVGLLLFTVMTGLIPLHLTLKWWTALISAAAVVALAVLVGIPLAIAAPLGSFMLALVLVLRSSLWLLDLVDQIEKVRQVEGKLALAEERLRFSRDLHDVMGRDLSSIAVTAELVTQLAERGDPRAAEHARSISAMARSSLADVRALVRGYRDVDLPPELQGTLSLLRSAGISTHVHGEADDVPAEHAEAATWALREAGTNLLRHADATTVRIILGPDGMRVVNDGATPPASAAPTAIVEGSGLRGLRERLGPTRTLRTEQDGDTFTLDIRFTPEENHDQS